MAGDRQTDGIFPLWSIAENISIGSLRALTRLGLVDAGAEAELARGWRERIGIRTPDMGDNILTLSGGNQQKALFARALGSAAEIVLMDDPMRGVDVGTKREVYAMIRAEAEAGAPSSGTRPSWTSCSTASTSTSSATGGSWPTCPGHGHRGGGAARLVPGAGVSSAMFSRRTLRDALPALSLAVLLAAIFWLQPRTMSYVGLNLMLNLAIPIALATIAQMCVITVNDLDLGIGTYVGFVACVAATWLVETPLLGIAALAGGILVYAALGALIQLRNLPSIVVTLGMSFVWLGLSVLVLPTPGGKAPEWVRWLMTQKPAYLPLPIIAAGVIALLAHVLLMRTSYGAVLRGAGGNPGRSSAPAGRC